MSKNQIVPISQIARRPPEAGRIRIGVKSGKAMKSIEKLRFTSPNRRVIDQLAHHYGGTVKPWHDDKANPKDQFEVISSVSEIPVYVLPDGLSQWYELWSGGGCQRRCDGQTCAIPKKTGPDDYEMVDVPCMCDARGLRECKPYTRLSVVIPAIEFTGVWRLDTKSWNAQAELPGMFDMIIALGQQGRTVRGILAVERRERMTPAGKRNYVVPKLTIDATAQELVSGTAGVAGIAAASTSIAALEAGASVDMPPVGELMASSADDEIVDAEVLDDELVAIEADLAKDAAYFGLDGHRFVAAVRRQIGATGSASPEQRGRLRAAHARMQAGTLAALGFNPDGSIQWKA